MALLSDTTNSTLRQLIRSIDKKADYTVAAAEGERPAVTVHLSLRKRSGAVTIPLEELEAAGLDTVRRNQVRLAIKRVVDRMGFQAAPVVSTKTVRMKTDALGFFRTPQGGGGRGGGRR